MRVKANFKYYRLKIWAKLDELKDEMTKTAKHYRKGQPATAAEYSRIVLVVAFAACNPCNCILLFKVFSNLQSI
jgi:hypothetical protein